MTSNSNASVVNKNVTVLLMEKVVPNVKIEFNKPFEFPDPDFHNKDFIDEHFVKSFLSRNKYDALNDQLKNLFLSKEKRDTLLDYFMQTQKIYWTFKRFARKVYIKNHIKESPHTVDLTLNPLSSHPEHLKVKIIQQDIIYTFYINDIIKIINSSLTYAPDMFSEPTQPKNPYINLPFTTGNLLAIYNFVAASNKVMPKLLHAFFLSEFNIPKFHIEYESLIREEVLKKHYDDASDRKLYNDIIMMLRYHRRSCRGLRIHPEFDKEQVIKHFKCMLLHHLQYQYSYQPTKRLFSKRIIKQYLEKFVENNPEFGKMTGVNRFSSRTNTLSNENPFNLSQLNYSISANLLDESFSEAENVFDILEELNSRERLRARRRIRLVRPGRPAQPPPPPPQPESNQNEEHDIEEGEVSDIEEEILDDVNEEAEEDDDEDQEDEVEDNNQADTFSSGPNSLAIIGTSISNLDLSSNSVYVDNSTNTITSRYVSNSHPSRGARIEYTTHTVTRYPGTSSTLSRSSYSNNTTSLPPGLTATPPGLRRTYTAIDNIISNIYNPPPTSTTLGDQYWGSNSTSYNSSQITSNINSTTSNSNINIYETHNSPFDASMDIVDDSEVDTPTSDVSNVDPFAQSYPSGFNPVHDDNDNNNNNDNSS